MLKALDEVPLMLKLLLLSVELLFIDELLLFCVAANDAS